MSAIENLYTSILGRPSDAGGKQYWDAELTRRTQAGENRQAVLDNIADSFRLSSEYLGNQSNSSNTNTGGGSSNTGGGGGGSSNTGGGGGGGGSSNTSGYDAAGIGAHLDSLYTGFFNRDADQAGKDYWLRAIQEGHHGSKNPYQWLTESFQQSDEYLNRDFGGGGNDDGGGITQEDLNNAIAGIQFPQQDQGMGDFMKFMMLMSMMRGGGGFGGMGGMGGYGGSQYGYGGLHPGGVMQSQDPLALLQGMGSWFRDNFGSGAGTSTGTVNTGSGATGGTSGN